MEWIRNRLGRASAGRDALLVDLSGLDEIDWGQLTHAYGAAGDVPTHLRSLASSRAEDREHGLWELFGSIVHQGTIYEASAPAVPFLVTIATTTAVPDRAGVVRLLAELANGSGYVLVHRGLLDATPTDELDAEEQRERGWIRAATAAVLAAVPSLEKLLADPDLEVRRAAAYLLARLPEAALSVRDALLARFPEETDPATRAGIVIALAVVADRAGDRTAVQEVLAASRKDKPAVRLAAGIATLVLEPESVGSVVDWIIDSAHDGAAGLEATPWAEDGVVPVIGEAIGDRPAELLQLVRGLANSPTEAVRLGAVGAAGNLTQRWRSITPASVALLAKALDDRAASVRQAAAAGLAGAYPAVVPAADALARHAEDPDEQVAWRAIVTLARLRDPRVLPRLASAIEAANPPEWVGSALEGFGEDAVMLLPGAVAMLQRLQAEPAIGVDNLIPETMSWIGSLGSRAEPAVSVLAGHLGSSRTALAASAALARLGPTAVSAAGALRDAANHPERSVRAHASVALWRIDGDAGPLLRLATDVLGDPRAHRVLVLEYLEDLGPRAEPVLHLVEPLLADRYDWNRVRAARVCWLATRDSQRVLDVLVDAATPMPVGLPALEALGWIGPPAAAIVPTLREWLTRDRRLGTADHGFPDAVEVDENLRSAAARAIARITEGPR